jgi:hypothetical protein
MEGWIKLHRQISENDLWVAEPFTDGQAWIDILLLANHKEGYIKIRGIRHKVERGQVGWSEVKLAARWKWSRGKVRRFLSFLENEKMIKIVQQKIKLTTIISVCNYLLYQGDDTSNGTTNDTTNGHQTDTNKNDKKEKKKENSFLIQVYFEKNKELDKAFKDYLELRIKSKYTMTDRAINALIVKLRKLSNGNVTKALKIIDEAIIGKWKSFYELKEK